MYKITWPNRITIGRLLLIGPFVVALMNLQVDGREEFARWSAVVIFGLMAFSDGLDGWLARRLQQETAVGRFLDPLADKILIFCSVILLAHDGTHVTGAQLPPTVAVIAVGKDLTVVLGFCIVYFITSDIYIEARRSGKLCTTVQLAMVIAILLSPSLPDVLRWLPRVLWWSATVLATIALVDYFRQGMARISRHEAEVEAAEDGE